MVEMKKCSKCGDEKEACKENFHWRNDSKKFRNKCILCFRDQTYKYRMENIEKVKISKKK
jgi:hypothetical protein